MSPSGHASQHTPACSAVYLVAYGGECGCSQQGLCGFHVLLTQFLILHQVQVMLERLKNEVTRLTATKGFATLAGSARALDLSPVLDSMFMELTRFLRMANRPLRQAALQALEVGVIQGPLAA